VFLPRKGAWNAPFPVSRLGGADIGCVLRTLPLGLFGLGAEEKPRDLLIMGIVHNKGDAMAVYPPRVPYWRLSSFYLFYFASLGALVPYWGLFLKSRGLGAEEIGGLFSLIMVTKMAAPNVWGWRYMAQYC
jgi:hypothetical protein